MEDREHPIERVKKISAIIVQMFSKPPFSPLSCDGIKRIYNIFLGVVDIREIALGLHGRLIPFVPDGYIIDINKHDDRRVKNFTICHEIGHIVLQEGRPLEKQNTRTSDYFTEKMCDMIAAGLLMPKPIFIREATEMWPSFSSIQAIADRFDVTPRAAQRRILDLKIWNCAVGYWVPKLADFPAAGFVCRWGKWNPRLVGRINKIQSELSIAASYTYRTGKVTREKFSNGLTIEFRKGGRNGGTGILSLAWVNR